MKHALRPIAALVAACALAVPSAVVAIAETAESDAVPACIEATGSQYIGTYARNSGKYLFVGGGSARAFEGAFKLIVR